MNQPNKFDPPDSVVAPAFRELFDRLRRAQMSNKKKGEITAEERKAFEYGVAERQKVLGHSLFLVFAQWAIYRQAISRIKSRAIRLTYAMGAVVSTSWFVQRRAAKVSKDTFAHIVTTNMDSALGNEARIILAELEGPEGPYFRQVCREREFVTDFSAVPMDDEHDDDLHPQLRLKPRLLVEMPPHPQIMAMRRERPEKGTRSRTERQDWRVTQRTSDMRRDAEGNRSGILQTINHRRMGAPAKESDTLEEEIQNETNLKDLFTGSEELERLKKVERARQRKQAGGKFVPDDQEDFWGKPFDFSKAAREREQDNDFDPYSDINGFTEDDRKPMTPSQRRAAERRLRRLRAEARTQRQGDDQ
ncbi:hypothetical protein FGB62_68g173 [Gracilaria domingensis]|nr:hypothetical protein FGB62_95g072 [Gracilaria domingensis]KAI0562001.1 hypothetical protein FGB62_68g173 [Gracilaria domingensis]